jgi:hypothetical protein
MPTPITCPARRSASSHPRLLLAGDDSDKQGNRDTDRPAAADLSPLARAVGVTDRTIPTPVRDNGGRCSRASNRRDGWQQLTIDTCPPRWSARKTLLYGLASDSAVDNGTGRNADSAAWALARRPVPSRWVIGNRCSAMDLNEMRCLKVVVPQPPPPSIIFDPPTPQRPDDVRTFFSRGENFPSQQTDCATTLFRCAYWVEYVAA